MKNVLDIEKNFKNKDLFEQALTHRSWVNEHKGIRGTNERLEFLGDAILEYIVSREIYLTFSKKEEGFMTALRANLVNTVNLARVARSLNIGSALFLSKGEEETGGRDNNSLLADTMEAIIGAIFIDQGIGSVEKFIKKFILVDLKKFSEKPLKDPKSSLQELVQARGKGAPKYRVISENGPDHNKVFVVEVLMEGKPLAKAKGKNKSEAEQKAAKEALSLLKKDNLA